MTLQFRYTKTVALHVFINRQTHAKRVEDPYSKTFVFDVKNDGLVTVDANDLHDLLLEAGWSADNPVHAHIPA